MDDRRIERALREGPPDEPAYERSIAAQIRTRAPDTLDTAGGEAAYRGVVRRAGVSPRFGSAALVAVAAALVLAVVALRPFLGEGPGGSTPPDLLGRLRAEGRVRIAVTADAPQTTAAGGSVIGFDVDVARALASALDLEGQVSVVTDAGILQGLDAEWDIGLPSRGPAVGSGVTAGPAYYAWPSWLVTDAASTITSREELEGATICVVTTSAGPAWLAGGGAGVDAEVEPPPGAIAVERANDAACIAAIQSGQAEAAVTAQLLDDELAGQGLRALVDTPVVRERRVIVVRGTGAEVTTLLAAFDELLRDPTTSQALADASRRAFGGRDLTEGTP